MSETNSAPIQEASGVENVLEHLRKHNVDAITTSFPAPLQDGFFLGKRKLVHQPYPLIIMTVTLFHYDYLPILLPYLSLAMDMLVIDELHFWPGNQTFLNSTGQHLDNFIYIQDLQQLLQDYGLIESPESTFWTSSKVRIFHYQKQSPHKVEVNQTQSNQPNFRHNLFRTYYQFYAGLGAVRSEDIILRCSDEVTFLDVFHLEDMIEEMQRQLPWYSATTEMHSSIAPIGETVQNTTSISNNIPNVIYVPNLLSENISWGLQRTPIWPQSWVKLAQSSYLTPSYFQQQLQIHRYFLSHWSVVLFSAEHHGNQGAIFGKRTRRVRRVYISACQPTVSLRELPNILADLSEDGIGNNNDSTRATVPKSVLLSYLFDDKPPLTPNASQMHHLHPAAVESYMLASSKQLFLRRPEVAVTASSSSSSSSSSSVQNVTVLSCCSTNSASATTSQQVPSFTRKGIRKGRSKRQPVSENSVDTDVQRSIVPGLLAEFAGSFVSKFAHYLSKEDTNSIRNIDAWILQSYADRGHLQMIAGQMVVMTVPRVEFEEEMDNSYSDQYGQEMVARVKSIHRLVAQYRSLASQYQKFIE
jgi:hypothetical protein